MPNQFVSVTGQIVPAPPSRTTVSKTNRNRFIPPDIPRVESGSYVSTEASLRIFKPHISKLVSPAELKELRDAQDAIAALRSEVERYGNRTAKDQFKAALRKYEKDPSPENAAELGRLSRVEELSAEHAKVRVAVKSKITATANGVFPILEKIYDRAGEIVSREMTLAAEAEKKLCETFGVDWRPAGPVQALQNLARRLNAGPTPIFGSVRTALEGIVEL